MDIMQKPYNNWLCMINSENLNELNSQNIYYNDSLNSDNRIETSLNIKSYIFSNLKRLSIGIYFSVNPFFHIIFVSFIAVITMESDLF